MSAVLTAARAAVRRRWWQTVAIGVVVLFATITVVLGVSLLLAASGPFDKAYDRQQGAHVVAGFDAAKVTDAQLAATAHRPGVTAVAGPFGLYSLQFSHDWLGYAAGPLVVAGRADPGGAVDRVDLQAGRWATAPGEIVINADYQFTGGQSGVGARITPDGVPPLTVVGYATSMSASAGAWVTPAQLDAWHPTGRQMLYRFEDAGSAQQVQHSLAVATDGLPVASAQSYLALKQIFGSHVRMLLPILSTFAALGLVTAVLLTGNVVTGAVIAGYRHIGVLKALGFTSRQVIAVYLAMIGIPALAGSLLGTLAGVLLTGPTLNIAFGGIPVGTANIAAGPWAAVAGLAGVLAVVTVTALVPALRAGRLPAAEAISAGSAPRSGRGLRAQRYLAGVRLPRAVSLGLGLPSARPGRTVMTLAAVVLGVATATLSTGLTSTITKLTGDAGPPGPRMLVTVGTAQNGLPIPAGDTAGLLHSLPGTTDVVGRAFFRVSLAGSSKPVYANFYTSFLGYDAGLVAGRTPAGPLEAAAGTSFLALHGLKVGDRMALAVGGRSATFTIVGRTFDDNSQALDATWDGIAALSPGTTPLEYRTVLAPGTDTGGWAASVKAVQPSLDVETIGDGSALTYGIETFAIVFTCFLGFVAAVGVLNTVLLTVRERRRDLGVLKSIGMTPRQVVTMTVASVAVLGLAGGLLGVPVGVAAHRLILDNLGDIELPAAMKNIWTVPLLALPAVAGLLIAVLGALPPARTAARLPVAAVLHNE